MGPEELELVGGVTSALMFAATANVFFFIIAYKLLNIVTLKISAKLKTKKVNNFIQKNFKDKDEYATFFSHTGEITCIQDKKNNKFYSF